MFKYVSLFSGIGGFEQALNRIGGKCVLSSETNKYANMGYKALYGHETVGDVRKIAAEDVPDHDLMVAGFPCQAFSVQGLRKGFEDARGTLFFEVARIANIKKPKVILLENVKGLVSHDKGRTLDVIVNTLNSLGYAVDFNVLNSRYFGVPHNRERIFIIAIRDAENESWTISGNNTVAKAKKRIASYEDVKTFNFDWSHSLEETAKLVDILEEEVDESYFIGADRMEQLVYPIEGISGLAVREATKQGYAVAEVGDSINVKFLNSKTRRGRVGRGVSHTLEVTHGIGTLTADKRVRLLTPRETFRLQGFSDSEFDKLKDLCLHDAQLYRLAGNAVTVNVIEHLGNTILKYLNN